MFANRGQGGCGIPVGSWGSVVMIVRNGRGEIWVVLAAVNNPGDVVPSWKSVVLYLRLPV